MKPTLKFREHVPAKRITLVAWLVFHIAAGTLLGGLLLSGAFAQVRAESESRPLHVEYSKGLVKVRAIRVPFADVLKAVGDAIGAEVFIEDVLDDVEWFEVEGVPAERAIRLLLRDTNFYLVYGTQKGRMKTEIKKVIVLGSGRGSPHGGARSGRSRVEESYRQAQRQILSPSPSRSSRPSKTPSRSLTPPPPGAAPLATGEGGKGGGASPRIPSSGVSGSTAGGSKNLSGPPPGTGGQGPSSTPGESGSETPDQATMRKLTQRALRNVKSLVRKLKRAEEQLKKEKLRKNE